LNRLDGDPIESPKVIEEDEELFARLERDLALVARVLEMIGPDALSAPQFHGMPSWYPRMLASYLRSMLTPSERELTRSLHRAGVRLDQIVDRVTRDRLRRFAGLLPQLADASKCGSYAKVPNLDRWLEELLWDLKDDDFGRLRDLVWPDAATSKERLDATGPSEARQNDPGSAQSVSGRLRRALGNPSLFVKGTVPSRLQEISVVLNELYRDGDLPAGNRWTEPLLALIATKRVATESSNPVAGK
jgi:hypothetical protein